jgi:hypothetical protein
MIGHAVSFLIGAACLTLFFGAMFGCMLVFGEYAGVALIGLIGFGAAAFCIGDAIKETWIG